MSNRPDRRPSQLAGQTPVKPQADPEPLVEPSATPEATTPVETAPAPGREPGGKEPKKGEPKTKVGFYMTNTDLLRAQRAHTTTIIHTGARSWTAYVNEAVMVYTKQLEKEHNDSKPF